MVAKLFETFDAGNIHLLFEVPNTKCRKVVLKRFCFKVSSIQVLVLFHYGPYNTVK